MCLYVFMPTSRSPLNSRQLYVVYTTHEHMCGYTTHEHMCGYTTHEHMCGYTTHEQVALCMGLHARLGAHKDCWIRILDESLVMMVSPPTSPPLPLSPSPRELSRSLARSLARARALSLSLSSPPPPSSPSLALSLSRALSHTHTRTKVIETSTVAAPRCFYF
jgi:hypothetical protein